MLLDDGLGYLMLVFNGWYSMLVLEPRRCLFSITRFRQSATHDVDTRVDVGRFDPGFNIGIKEPMI